MASTDIIFTDSNVWGLFVFIFRFPAEKNHRDISQEILQAKISDLPVFIQTRL
jgi:hypothetical protein